uniref:Preprotein-translocase subunit g n=1 Tax=Lophurella stichidiosa TaxID=2008659 RepID=UPI002551EAE6|nr:Preprotein-translocase subunit g [Aphanocladia stichidiosa]WGH14056.1 Preprotein-translocase subunit g [Aphanocladia stichidiosa]
MFKFFWYLFSFLTLCFVLLSTPNNSNIGSSMNQNQIFHFRSNKLFVQKIIAFNIFMFFIFTIFSLL